MANNTTHTARYQLDRFINSEQHLKLDLALDGTDIAILYVIFGLMDASDKKVCFAKQTVISSRCCVPVRTLKRRLQRLVKLNLILIQKIGYLNHYYIGSKIKEFVNIFNI